MNYIYSRELYHHGVRGQKWGIRRYQNKDGSLTPLGKKRAAKLESKYEKVTGKKISKNTTEFKESKPKPLTDEELIARTNRLNVEKNYLEAQKNYITAQRNLDSLNPKQVSRGEEFAKAFLTDVVKPVATNTAKNYIESVLKSKLGLNKPSEYDLLKKEVDNLELKARKAKAKNIIEAREKVKKKEKEEQEAKEKERRTRDEETVWEGTVEGKGRSRTSQNKNDDYVDAEYTEIINPPAIYKRRKRW